MTKTGAHDLVFDVSTPKFATGRLLLEAFSSKQLYLIWGLMVQGDTRLHQMPCKEKDDLPVRPPENAVLSRG